MIRFSALNFHLWICSTLICITVCVDKTREVILKWPAFCIKVQWKNAGNLLNVHCHYLAFIYHWHHFVNEVIFPVHELSYLWHIWTDNFHAHKPFLLAEMLMDYFFPTFFNFFQPKMSDNSNKSFSSSGFLKTLHIPPWIKGKHYSSANVLENNPFP